MSGGSAIATRLAEPADEPALQAIDARTWSPAVTPAPEPPADRAFFGASCLSADVLVGVLDGVVAGNARLGHELPVASHAHVLSVTGVAVDPDLSGGGVGRGVRVIPSS